MCPSEHRPHAEIADARWASTALKARAALVDHWCVRGRLLSLLLPLGALPGGWPHEFALGLADPPGDAKALVRNAPLDLRYQYLAGAVNTGSGWAGWNPSGSFASMYVRESPVSLP